MKTSSISAAVAVFVVSTAACAPRPASPQVEWKISWAAVTATADGKAVSGKPKYLIEDANDEHAAEWKTVWQGETTDAVVKTAPGRHCFRVLSVIGNQRSDPSPIGCGTKLANNAGPAQKSSS